MKVLLAPLSFHSRFCKHCARIFYRKNPERWLGIHEFEALPPLGSFDVKRGFIPDFATLLMFEEFVLDGEGFERLKNPGKRPWLNEWAELIEALESEGSISIADVSLAANSNSHTRGWMLRRDLTDRRRWWQAMGYFEALTGLAQASLGDSPQEAKNMSWQFDPDACFGIRGSDGEVHDLSVILYDGENCDCQAHRELFATALDTLKRHLCEVNSCLMACSELDVAPVMWAPYRRYLEEKLPTNFDTTALDFQSAGRQFFEIAFPAYLPTTVRHFCKLRMDKRIKALRAEIYRAFQQGELFEHTYPQRVLTEVLHFEQKSSRIRRIAGWIANAVGTIPIPGLGLAAAGASEVISGLLERKQKKQWHWFYLISDGRGGT